jgi:hypothetical protein
MPEGTHPITKVFAPLRVLSLGWSSSSIAKGIASNRQK